MDYGLNYATLSTATQEISEHDEIIHFVSADSKFNKTSRPALSIPPQLTSRSMAEYGASFAIFGTRSRAPTDTDLAEASSTTPTAPS